MDIDLDRYYTPINLAEDILTSEFPKHIGRCVDTTCGTGNLLLAATNAFDDVTCIGLDRDRSVISTLKRKNPEWILSVADLMKSQSYNRTTAIEETNCNDLLLLNPPFSHGSTKSLAITYKGKNLKCSVAMAHILKSFELFKPEKGAMIIAPESVMYSDTDEAARNILREEFQMSSISELDNQTFSGARVRANVLRILVSSTHKTKKTKKTKKTRTRSIFVRNRIRVEVVRGSLPVHQAPLSRRKGSVPFIHTTALRDIVLQKNLRRFPRTKEERKGRVTGNLILLPRVGVPILGNIAPIELSEEIQLSDCVFALKFCSNKRAIFAASRLRSEFLSLESIYKGTAARYTMSEKLRDWLSQNGFLCEMPE